MKHTPGPWHVVTTERYQTIRSNAHVIADMRFSGGSVINSHDAALIAAAPDLLAACRYVIDWHREHDSGEGELFGLDFVTTCIAAVHRAEEVTTP